MSDETTPEIPENKKSNLPVFTFQRMGGLDQVVMLNDEEWQNLDKLDPKLWMALSCPIQGLEFSHATLDLLDTDHNGRVRAQEVKEAVEWICERLVHPSCLRESSTDLALEALRTDTEAGEALHKAADLALDKHPKEKSATLTLPEVEEVITEASGYPFNGDGIVPPDSAPAPSSENLSETRNFITMAMSIVGAMKDASGKPGLDENLVKELDSRLKAALDWRDSVKSAHMPLGDNTGAAWTLLQKVAPKLDDYFSRCNLEAFSPATLAKITENGSSASGGEGQAASAPNILISPTTLLELPLSKVNADGILDIQKGLNPAWSDDIQEFCRLVAPIVGGSLKKLDEKDWNKIKGEFSEYAAVLSKKPEWPVPDADSDQVNYPDCPTLALAPQDDPFKRAFLPLQPGETIASLSDEQIKTLLDNKVHEEFAQLVQKDLAAPPLASFEDLRKLMLYKGNLYTFLRNFLSFLDFYEKDKKAIFQSGVLYLDSRSCRLCVPVDDVENHARLSESSHLCLIYCECYRLDAAGVEHNCTIAAALTAGTLAALIDGRHGLFIDNDGNEWDTKIIRIVHNPISLREAVWAPYIRVSNMIGEQIQKFVSSKEESAGALTDKAANSLISTAQKPAPAAAAAGAAAAPKEGFDFAKNAGIFAALSVALSVLSAAFAYIANSVASLGWWWPLAIVVIFLCISGPSVVSAWFKLRKRSLGPLLDASGWAVNKGAPINLIMGASLTQVGKLPPNATHDYNDPYTLPELMRAKKRRAWIKAIILLLILACCGAFWLYCVFWGQPAWLIQFRGMLGI